jgi:hypothetical protein
MLPTTSNKELDKYKDLCSQLATEFVEFYNDNLGFFKTLGREPGYAARKHLRNIEDLAKQLKKQSQLVNKENLANLRIEAKLNKLKAKKKSGPRGRPKKNQKPINNDMDTSRHDS